MAEMTAAEAKIFIVQELKALSGPEGCSVQTMQRNQTKRTNLRGLAALLEQQAAEIGRLKLLCEKKTIENCKVIKQSFREGVGRPEMIDGKCEGYAISDWDDEPHDSCKECIAGMESEEAWLQEMEGRR